MSRDVNKVPQNQGPQTIVVIMTDTQRKDMVNCYVPNGLSTPHLDRLAAGGVRFENAYCAQPVCGPARSALFTGMFPHTTGSVANNIPLAMGTLNVGQRLSMHGFRTVYIGKWHLDGGDYFGYGKCPAGWDPDYWYDMKSYLDELSERDRTRSRSPETAYDENFDEGFTFAHRVSDRAIRCLSQRDDRPLLLVVSYDEPHHPWLSPPSYYEMYRDYEFPLSTNVFDSLESKPEHQKIWARESEFAHRRDVVLKNPYYFGCNSYVDYEIGRVIDAIDREAPDALVIYTSDHGESMESHGITNKGPIMYEEVVNVPFIVRWPRIAPEGLASDSLVSHVDLVPTVLDAAGIRAPRVLEGKSLVPVFTDPGISVRDDVCIEFTRYEIDHDGFGGYQPIRCIYDGRHKLAINLLTTDEFYDLENDPEEMHNLIDDAASAEVRDSLHDRLLAWMNETRDPYRGYYWERRPWRTDARPATWDYTSYTRQKEEDWGQSRQLNYSDGLVMDESVRSKSGK